MPILLQLKSAQKRQDLDDISGIIRLIKDQNGYKVRGHEIQQLASVIKETTLAERAGMVSDFCSRNEIDYLAYHAPIFEDGKNIWDEKWGPAIQNSILQTIEEADMVRTKSGIKNDAIVVFHLTYYVTMDDLPITAEKRIKLQSRAEEAFIRFFEKEGLAERKGILMALENSFPKYYSDYAIAGPYHPSDLVTLQKQGVGTVFDLSHYHLYSNYVRHGRGNFVGDLDKEIHGTEPPSWQECIDILSDSLVQLHISDARGFDPAGEGLSLGKGDIPIKEALQSVHELKRTIRGTIELDDGHLDHSRRQLEAARWLLKNAKNVLC